MPMENHCTVSRAYDIADEHMYELFLAHSRIADESTGYRERTDKTANEAALWLIGRGMARVQEGGLIELTDMPMNWLREDDDE